jgi:polar amino acid transport system substrate-binding protein
MAEGDIMQLIRAGLVLLTLAIGGCASMQTNDDTAAKALAPTGAIRVGFLAGPLYATRDQASGELSGVAVDLSRELAKRLGTTAKSTAHPNPGAILASAKAGELDVGLMGVSAERAEVFDFSPPYMEVEQGYLVRAGVPIRSAAEVDQRDITVAVVQNTGADQYLSRNLKSATIVRMKSLQDLEPSLTAGKVDVAAATKTFLYARATGMPGARVLDGRFLVEPIAIAIPKGRDAAALAFVAEFVAQVKRSGLVAEAIERAGLKGVSVAP